MAFRPPAPSLFLFGLAAYCPPFGLAAGGGDTRGSGEAQLGRAAHYVIRTSDLHATLSFLSDVAGLRVIRHEENAAACPITCNGRYATPWSKTMVGWESEDRGYALEITYNYGVDSYLVGGGLKEIVLVVDDYLASRAAAQRLGYAAKGSDDGSIIISGPDGYTFVLRSGDSNGTKGRRFDSVTLRVPDPAETAKWYSDVLGMRRVGAASVAYDPIQGTADPVHFHFVAAASPYTLEQWDGRNMFSLPAARVRAIHTWLKSEAPERIVHDLQELHEELGTLLILIVSDPNGLEICLASSETFDAAVRVAADWKGPDWGRRSELASEYASASAHRNRVTGLRWRKGRWRASAPSVRWVFTRLNRRSGGGAGPPFLDDFAALHAPEL